MRILIAATLMLGCLITSLQLSAQTKMNLAYYSAKVDSKQVYKLPSNHIEEIQDFYIDNPSLLLAKGSTVAAFSLAGGGFLISVGTGVINHGLVGVVGAGLNGGMSVTAGAVMSHNIFIETPKIVNSLTALDELMTRRAGENLSEFDVSEYHPLLLELSIDAKKIGVDFMDYLNLIIQTVYQTNLDTDKGLSKVRKTVKKKMIK